MWFVGTYFKKLIMWWLDIASTKNSLRYVVLSWGCFRVDVPTHVRFRRME